MAAAEGGSEVLRGKRCSALEAGGGRGVGLEEGPGPQVKAPLPGIGLLGPQCPRPPLASS